MRWRPFTWFLLSVFFFVAAAFFWGLGDQWAAKKAALSAPQKTNQATSLKRTAKPGAQAPFHLLTQPGNLNLLSASSPPVPAPQKSSRFPNRLSNTSKPIKQLQYSEKAILLQNVLLDTEAPLNFGIPDHLKAHGEAGAYIIQSKTPLDQRYRTILKEAGAQIVSAIPNNAYLIVASAAAVRSLGSDEQTQVVLPWEPYYKLDPALLKAAVEKQALPENTFLSLLLFPNAGDKTIPALQKLQAEIVRDEMTPIGQIVTLRAPPGADTLPAIAALNGVQIIEPVRPRMPANDLSREMIGVASNSIAPNNYLDLTGSNILVNVNDTGIDASHPDFSGGRILGDSAASLIDTDGHGTHVAGIIGGSGAMSTNVNNAAGSIMPAVDLQFRGKAPASKLFSVAFDPINGPFPTDTYMQELAARTNAFISNNGWNYGTLGDNSSYDLAAASYDAAVRDALPRVTGSQPVLFVFSAGNNGNGLDDGSGGSEDSIQSPGSAKNVLTVGGIELPRNITNSVLVDCVTTNINGTNVITCTTNTPWTGLTDASDQVARFSSRGNVGVGVEGDSGRFKPDVVAPATFVVSTRSTQWDELSYYNRHDTSIYREQTLGPGGRFFNFIFMPENATRLSFRTFPISPIPFPGVAILLNKSDSFSAPFDVVATNNLTIGPAGLSPLDTVWSYQINNSSTQRITFNLRIDLTYSNANDGQYFQVLSNLNNSLETNGTTHYYRYESGTSMAAADASGTLALMQEFLQNRLGHKNAAGQFTNSPALMKALLINGARSVGNNYDFQTTNTLNAQGWGLINLTNSLHGGLATPNANQNSMFLFDQSPAKALATGQSHTRNFSLTPDGQGQPLRVSLVWTDPAGNPAASIKLVNDLDLIVTNLDNGDVFFGNDILPGNDFNLAWQTNGPPPHDVINNVENVYLPPPLGTNYSITVFARHVNVNAVTAHPDNVVQDYALVVSSGDGVITNAMSLGTEVDSSPNVPFVTVITNTFQDNPQNFGAILTQQRVGANTPLLGNNKVPYPTDANAVITLGMANQWHFYMFSNSTTFTNAAFSTFAPPNLSATVMGVRQGEEGTNEARVEADIDLYVSLNRNLTNLAPAAVLLASKSVSRGGTETIILSNAIPGAVYYIGVKSEDQRAAEYSLAAIASELPFSDTDAKGNVRLRGVPAPAVIPDGSPLRPGGATILAFAPDPSMRLHRVIVTNIISHQLMGDLFGALTHQGQPSFTVLNNHSIDSAVTNAFFIYDDSSERNVPGAQHTDGPGSLMDFAGQQAGTQWQLTMLDNAENHIGTNIALTIFLERQQELTNGIIAVIEPGACREDFLLVPPNATQLTLTVGVLSGTGPLSFEVCSFDSAGQEQCRSNYINSVGSIITIDRNDIPPLTAGPYFVRLCNLGIAPVTVNIRAQLNFGVGVPVQREFTLTNPVPILDDAVTTVTNFVTNHFSISSLEVGLLIKHPRVSDLAITLISPNGTRILLTEDRGALSTTGLGTFSDTTNSLGLPAFAVTSMTPFYTNSFERALTGVYMPGVEFEDWSVLTNSVAIVRDLNELCRNNNVLVPGDGIVSNSLPTTNSTSYRLSFNVTHSPYIVGMVSWWPLDDDAMDIYGGLDGILCGDPQFVQGKVDGALKGDGVGSSMMVPRCPDLDLGTRPGFTIEGWINPGNINNAAPLVEWNDATVTNGSGIGVQWWLSGRFAPGGGAGSLSVNLRDTNNVSHIIETPPLTVTNAPNTNSSAWQHVALTYDAATFTAKLYANGKLITSLAVSASTFVPKTISDLYFGYHAGPTAISSSAFLGGLDEFSIYEKALCDCDIAAIASAGSNGKYGTNALTCPVTNMVTINGVLVTNFVNGTNWVFSGPQWENNVIDFTNALFVGTNGIGTNRASIVITPVGCSGSAFDEFILSSLTTNFFDGLLHFTDDTNIAPVPIKFAPSPFVVSNFAPVLIFTNGFENATQGVQLAGSIIPGSFNNPSVGQMNWTATNGAVAVVPADGQGVTKAVALGFGAVQSTLPTIAGHRYQLSYSVRGPCAAGWWNGDVDPVSQRAQDLIGGNDGAFINGATNSGLRFVGSDSLFFPGMLSKSAPVSPDLASKIELGDPANLRFTNSFSIEGWIRPIAQTNDYILSLLNAGDEEILVEQIFFRGDSRQCLDPYYLALEQSSAGNFDLLFHVEDANSGSCGVTLEGGGDLITAGQWQHVAAVFESNVPWTNNPPWPTNQLRLYLDGIRVTNLNFHPVEDSLVDGFTSARPFANLDPGYSPGVAIGNRSRGEASEPFRGNIDELSVYPRALTEPEIQAIFSTGRAGKFDRLAPSVAQSLAKVSVQIDGDQKDVQYGDNATWTTHTFTFTALRLGASLKFQSLLPGTEIANVSLTEVPGELNYQPEEPLSQLNGQDAFGQWRLEIWDTRTGATNNDPQLVDWQLTFHLLPDIPPPVISLTHCVPYENIIPANSLQYFVVDVPQWASFATNSLLFAHERFGGNPLPVSVLFNQTDFPGPGGFALIGPSVSTGTNILSTTNGVPLLQNGNAYFLAVTNPNPVAVDFSVEVCFNINTLTNCETATNFVAGTAGLPTYFQFDVPTNAVPPGSPPAQVTVYLTGARSNLTVALSQSLPLPDLAHYDYISARPCTNDEVLLVLTNSTPFPIQSNHWYIGVFNSAATNVPFTITACYGTNGPTIIPLTNAVPYVADLTNQFVAPPGPPRAFFFEFSITNPVDAVLFELYNLSGDADLVLQKDVPPGQWPYFDFSSMTGTNSEQIVVRAGFDFPDLRGNWFLGVYNNESTNVSYTIRAITSDTNGMLISALPLSVSLSPLLRGGLLQWNSVVGETYEIQLATSLNPANWTKIASLVATTTCSTFLFPSGSSGFVRVVQVPPGSSASQPRLKIQLAGAGQVRISWPTSAAGFTLQSAASPNGPWTNVNLPVTVIGNELVVFDTIGAGPRFYRLFK